MHQFTDSIITLITTVYIYDMRTIIKYIIKNLAAQEGKTATFLPKPIYQEAGSGMHVHMLLMKDGQIKASGTIQELLAAMPEQVWSVNLPKAEVESYMKSYKVSNVKTVPGGAQLRIISAEKPADDAAPETATLEDLFLDYFGEQVEGDPEI